MIGGGPVGENVADRAVQGGLTAALIESELVGGECSYWACMPSKALLRSGHALRAAQRVNGSKQAVTGDLDVAAVFARRNEFVHDWNDASQVEWAQGAGIDLIRGHGRLTGERAVEVTAADGTTTDAHRDARRCREHRLRSAHARHPGLAEARPWTSREATSAQEAPASLAIIGGGVVAAEMATAYATFGTKVTLIAGSGCCAARRTSPATWSPRACAPSASRSSRPSPTRVDRSEDGVAIELADGDAIAAEELLVATGRTPAQRRPRPRDDRAEARRLAHGRRHAARRRASTGSTRTGDVNHRACSPTRASTRAASAVT